MVTNHGQKCIAIRLSKLLSLLGEECQLSEKEVRRQISQGFGKSQATQYFLLEDSKDSSIKRGKNGNSKGQRCVLIYYTAIEDQYIEEILKGTRSM